MELAPVRSYSLCRIHFTLIPSEENLLIHVDDRAITATCISSSNQEWLLESEAALKVSGLSKKNRLYPLTSSIFRLETSAALTSMKPEPQSQRWLGEAQISLAHNSVVTAVQPPPPQSPRPWLLFPSTFKSLSLVLNTCQEIYLLTSNKITAFGTV